MKQKFGIVTLVVLLLAILLLIIVTIFSQGKNQHQAIQNIIFYLCFFSIYGLFYFKILTIDNESFKAISILKPYRRVFYVNFKNVKKIVISRNYVIGNTIIKFELADKNKLIRIFLMDYEHRKLVRFISSIHDNVDSGIF